MAKKFRKGRVWRIWGPLLGIFLVATVAFECNKTSVSNTAFVSVIHTALGRDSLDVQQELGNDYTSILKSLVSYGATSGVQTDAARHPYIYTPGYNEVGVGVKSVEVREGTAGSVVSTGKTTFNNGRYYSMFLYEDSVAGATVPLFILPDNLVVHTADTFSYLRWINFSPNTYYNFRIDAHRPDSIYTGLIHDSAYSGFLNFLGNNENISNYAFKRLHNGNYWVRVYYDIDDSTRQPKDYIQLPDSINMISGKSYTAFVQGYKDSTGEKKLRLRVIQHN